MTNNNTATALKSVQQHYIKKEYSEAIDDLFKLKDKIDNGLFHYNLGSLYIKEGNLGAARYNLEKSKSLGFKNGIVKKNIEFIQSRPEVVGLQKSDHYFESTLHFITETSTRNISITCLLIAILILSYVIIRKMWHSTRLAVFTLLLLVPVGLKFYSTQVWRQAVILKDANILEGPSKVFEASGKLSSGSKVIISREHMGWYFVRYPMNYSGWVKREMLGLL